MTSNQLVTTYNIPSEKVKTFVFNRTMEKPEAEAKKFCKENNMKFIEYKDAEPYTLSDWQHYNLQTFKAECYSKTHRFWYEYGKL